MFQPFSDGAVAIYTGHLHASAIGRAVGDSTRVDAIRVIPREGQHPVAQGRVQRGVLDFVDSLEDGTYVYIGTATPIETSDVIAIVDPGMPSWLKESFDRNVPALFREYTNRLGAVLPVKPIVYFSFDQRGSGRASGGGTLAGLINMVLSGNEWRVQTPAAREQAFWLIAHESAHMWNGQLVSNADDGSHSWMHEGSADAMANDMLLRFGIVDSTTFHARREFALNNCLAAVATGSVETALRRGSTQSVYDCGFVMSMWAEALTRRSNAAVDLFGIWRALIASTRSKGSYDADRYFSTLASLGVTDDAVGRMRAFVASTDSASIALAGLREAGISAHVAEGSLPRAYQQRLARSALGHLMQQACSRVSFNWGDTVRTIAIPSCAPFAREHAVFRIQAIRVSDEGAALHDAVRKACAAGEGVTLHGKDNVLLATVPCTRALPERVPYYRLDR